MATGETFGKNPMTEVKGSKIPMQSDPAPQPRQLQEKEISAQCLKITQKVSFFNFGIFHQRLDRKLKVIH